MSLGYARSAQLCGAGYSSSGKTVTPTGISTPLTSKKASLLSQYSRAEEIAVLVSQ
jgi:hypothetical protein